MKKEEPDLLMTATLTGLCFWGAFQWGPVMLAGRLQTIPAILLGLGALGSVSVLSGLLTRLAGLIDWFDARRPTGRSGQARWATKREVKAELHKRQQGPFWGLLAGTRLPLFIDFASNALCIAPSGSGKGIYTVVTSISAIRSSSKVVADFKGELVCITKRALERRGERVRVLDFSGKWADLIGPSDCYNPIDMIVDDLYRPGGLRDIADDLRELTGQLRPEPGTGESDNSYFREGARRAMAEAILIEAMVEEYQASLSGAALLVEDRNMLERHLRWIIGIDLEGKPLPDGPMPIEEASWAKNHRAEDLEEFIELVRARASNLLVLMTNPESRTFDSFISDAQQALAPFASGRLAPVMRRSTFSMSELKDKERVTTLFVVADPSRPKTSESFVALIQWCALTALKRHPNLDVPVYFIMDEATNARIHGLESLLTWGRGFGIRLLIVIQSLSAFARVYGESAAKTLLSECEIKQLLPGQREPETLELIKKLLGEASVMSDQVSQDTLASPARDSVNEAARPLMTEDEIRRTSHALLFIRRQPCALTEPVSYAEIHPWRKQADINPYHRKPYLKRTRLKLKEK